MCVCMCVKKIEYDIRVYVYACICECVEGYARLEIKALNTILRKRK